MKSDAYYGKWRVHDRQVMRKLGPRRQPGTRTGLTRAQAEARLRALMAETSLPTSTERLTFEELGRRYIQHLEEVMQRKRTTIQDYRIMLLRHLGPFFGATEVAKLGASDASDSSTGRNWRRCCAPKPTICWGRPIGCCGSPPP